MARSTPLVVHHVGLLMRIHESGDAPNWFIYNWWNVSLAAGALLATLLGSITLVMRRRPESKRRAKFDPRIDPQSVEIEPGVYKSGLLKDDSRETLDVYYPGVNTLYRAFIHGMQVSGNGACLGTREGTSYEFITYEDIFKKSHAISSAFINKLGLEPGSSTNVGIYARNRPEWIITALACIRTSMVTVPLYDTLGAEAALYIIRHTGAQVIVVDNAAKAEKLIASEQEISCLKHIVLIDGTIDKAMQNHAREAGVQLHTFECLLREGEETPAADMEPEPDNVYIICYTSGTTGTPKGVVLTHRNVVANISAFVFILHQFLPELTQPGGRIISYLPLSHMFEQCTQWCTLMLGGTVGYFTGDVGNLSGDLTALKPSLLPMVPRLLNKFDDAMKSKVRKSGRLAQWLFGLAYSRKRAQLRRGIVTNNSIWDRLVFKKAQEEFGGNVQLVITGSAPISSEVLESCRIAIGAHVVEGYGQTEATAMATSTWPGESVGGHCGGPSVCSLIKLEDVPDLNYYAKDRKGEVLIKGPSVTKGYYKDEQKTAELFDDEGFLHTGDIGHILPSGAVKIIDRKKHIFKLAQGEYVAPEKIENVYVQSPLVHQVYVDGNSLERFLVAIVVPNERPLQEVFTELGNERSLEELCMDPKVISYVLSDLQKLGKSQKLNSIEQVKALHLESSPFTVENDLLTPTLKAKRPYLRQKYKETMKSLYTNA